MSTREIRITGGKLVLRELIDNLAMQLKGEGDVEAEVEIPAIRVDEPALLVNLNSSGQDDDEVLVEYGEFR